MVIVRKRQQRQHKNQNKPQVGAKKDNANRDKPNRDITNRDMSGASGTKEWSDASENCWLGCVHGCLYCYAYHMAKRYGHVDNYEDWTKHGRPMKKALKQPPKRDGRLMFPTWHDITEDNMEQCLAYLRKLLNIGNDVLIVMKPELKCVMAICKQMEFWKEQILFRFTIGSVHDEHLIQLEPGAPKFDERLKSLQYAYSKGYETSVSMEPYLDLDVDLVVERVEPYVTDTIWIGLMNKRETRMQWDQLECAEEWRVYLKDLYSEKTVRVIYDTLKDNEKIKWKESIRRLLDLENYDNIG